MLRLLDDNWIWIACGLATDQRLLGRIKMVDGWNRLNKFEIKGEPFVLIIAFNW